MKLTAACGLCASLLAASISALTIQEINGNRFLSPYSRQEVKNVTGVVTAKSSSGVYIRSERPSCDRRVSNALYLYGSLLAANTSVAVGDLVTVDGKVTEYRSGDAFLYLTELSFPTVRAIVKNATQIKPLVVGKDTYNPPTEQFTSLDRGDIFAVPNNETQVSVANPVLDPEHYGLDFWESLSGELVTVKSPVAIGKPGKNGETWVVGDWPTTGKNGRGGLTLGSKDANPESVIIGRPLDGTKSLSTFKIGDRFEDVTGIVTYQSGFYSVLPLTKLTFIGSAEPALPPPTTLVSAGTCSGITVGDYNIENFAPSDTKHVNDVAGHIYDYLKTPDILFLQEVQDNSGPTDDGVVSANVTLAALASAIEAASGGAVKYDFAAVDPIDKQDGGQPGGNIRVAYLYRPDVLRLRKSNPSGSLDANEVLDGPTLKYNPGRIDPANPAWESSRKPLVAEWETLDGKNNFFTVNVHWESKGDSTSLQGDPRPPVNRPVEKRTQQANVTATFIAQILEKDPNASVVMAGDCNEFSVVLPIITFEQVSGMIDLDVAADIPVNERYTYTYGNDMEELDHTFVSPAIAKKGVKAEHIHINTWVSYGDAVSDHDPTVAKLNVCK